MRGLAHIWVGVTWYLLVGRVIKVDLGSLVQIGSAVVFNPGEGIITASFGDSSGVFGYFVSALSSATAPVKVALSSMTRTDAIVIDANPTAIYLTALYDPIRDLANLVNIDSSDFVLVKFVAFTLVGSQNLVTGFNFYKGGVIIPLRGSMYVGGVSSSGGSPGGVSMLLSVAHFPFGTPMAGEMA